MLSCGFTKHANAGPPKGRASLPSSENIQGGHAMQSKGLVYTVPGSHVQITTGPMEIRPSKSQAQNVFLPAQPWYQDDMADLTTFSEF